MKTNYFTTPIPANLLLSMLTELCAVSNKCFIIDMPTYYKGIHKERIQQFMSACCPYYFPSKQFYTTNELTYKSFLTVVRHVCKIHGIAYTSQIQYSHSIYQVVYYIKIPPNYVLPPPTSSTSPPPSPPTSHPTSRPADQGITPVNL